MSSSKMMRILAFFSASTATATVFLHHNLTLDANGDILPWLPLPLGTAYDAFVVRTVYWFTHSMPIDTVTSLPIYYTHGQIPFVHWPHTPSRFTSWTAEGGAALLAYNGDSSLLDGIAFPHSRYLAGVSGTAPAGWAWAGAPFASSEPGQLLYRGANAAAFSNCGTLCCTPGHACPGDGINVTEPDKAANVGLGYARLYKLSGDSDQLTAALAVADALLANEVTTPNATHSPWPFRVRADTGAVVEPYSAQVVDALRFFDALADIARVGGTTLVPRAPDYAAARARVFTWLLEYPLPTNAWQGIWEDVPVWTAVGDDLNCHSALDAGAYLLDVSAPGALAAAARIIDWVVDTFVFAYARPAEPAVQWGALAVSEQTADRNKMAFHTLHWVSLAARVAALTGNASLSAAAARSFNWCTYVLQDDNQTLIGPVDQSNWITAGVRLPVYALAAIAAEPAWADPAGDHIVRSTGLVVRVSFQKASITYATYDPVSTEVLTLGLCTPTSVVAGGVALPRVPWGSSGARGWWAAEGGVLEVHKEDALEAVVACA